MAKKSKYLISLAQAEKMKTEYSNRQCTALSSAGNYAETEHAFIPIEVLEEYLANAKKYAKVKRTAVSGIQIDIVSYDWKKGSLRNPGKRLGISIVPTKRNRKKGTDAQKNSPLYKLSKKKKSSTRGRKSAKLIGSASDTALLGFPFPPPPPAP